MADDLRERIRAGDLVALTDPALPLHLLADGPTSEWWRDGTWFAWSKLVGLCIEVTSDRGQAVAELLRWAEPLVQVYGFVDVPSIRQRLVEDLQSENARDLCGSFVEGFRRVLCHVEDGEDNRAALALVSRLCALLPSVPPEVDAALAVLERYTG